MSHKGKVVLLDPSERARKLLAFRLHAMDFEPVEAADLLAAEKAMAGGAARLVITEWKVPEMEGKDLLTRLARQRTAILVFTERADAPEIGELGVPEVRGLFRKAQRTELLAKMEEVLGGGASEGAPEEKGGKHILLIEDSEAIRNFLRRILEKNFPGCVVREAEDGRQALTEMTSQKVDCIVTDLQMPGMDGQSFLKSLQRNPLLKRKPVLILSGSITSELREELKDCETVRLLAKPSSESEITRTLKELMRLGDPKTGS
jgi:two-component system chemotaxis response regulator CheY